VTPAEPALASALSGLAYAFMLVLARSAGAVALFPGLAETGVPARIRAGLAGAIALLLTPVVAPMVPRPPTGIGGFAAAIGAELLTGLWLGFLARLVTLALPIAGQILAGLLGQSNILQPDPRLGPQTAALAQMFALAAAVLVFVTGLYALPVEALAGSYRLFAPGSALPAGDGVRAIAEAVEGSFALAMRLAAPGIVLSALWSLAAGVAARIAPRVQVYFIAMPAQALFGLVLLAGTAAALLAFWDEAAGVVLGALPGLR